MFGNSKLYCSDINIAFVVIMRQSGTAESKLENSIPVLVLALLHCTGKIVQVS